jgi:signal transduction histidine kinase
MQSQELYKNSIGPGPAPLEMMGKMIAGIVHDLRNPIHFIKNFAQVSLETIESAGSQSEIDIDSLTFNLETIQRHAERLDQIIYYVLNPGETKEFDMIPMLDQMLSFTHHAHKNNFPLKVFLVKEGFENPILFNGNEVLLSRAFLNILDNAYEALSIDHEGFIKISIENSDSNLKIIIQDNGEGIDSDALDHIFEAYFTTKKSGTGLGLANTWDIIVNKHHGFIDVTSDSQNGTTFVISLPKHIELNGGAS